MRMWAVVLAEQWQCCANGALQGAVQRCVLSSMPVACGFSLAAREQSANMIWLDLLEIENGNFRA